jgi:hypothetical protein
MRLEVGPGWWNGRHRGLKILWAERPVRVRVPPPASEKAIKASSFRRLAAIGGQGVDTVRFRADFARALLFLSKAPAPNPAGTAPQTKSMASIVRRA